MFTAPASSRPPSWVWAATFLAAVSVALVVTIAVILMRDSPPDSGPPTRLGIHEFEEQVRQVIHHDDDLDLAGQKFDARFKGRVFELYGVVRWLQRHPDNKISIDIRAPWAEFRKVGRTITVTESTPLTLDMPVLVRARHGGWKSREGFEDAELVILPPTDPDHPTAWLSKQRR